MKKTLLFTVLLIIVTSINCYSQGKFEKAYFIDNNDERTDCLIYNNDWKNNPTSFRYKLDKDSGIQRETIDNIKEFVLSNNIKFQRFVVDIDTSSTDDENLSRHRRPDFKTVTIFLKQLVEGKGNLYEYKNGNGVYFFYSVNDTDCKQLIFKKYMGSKKVGNVLWEAIKKNVRFRQQILMDLKCDDLNEKDAMSLKYKKEDLVNSFVTYNKSENSKYRLLDIPKKRDLFNFGIRSGIRTSSYYVTSTISKNSDVDFGRKQNLSIGVEAEHILPFNNDQWSVFIEPTFQYFKSEKDIFNTSYDIKDGEGIMNYKSLEIPIGLRYNYIFNKQSKIFFNIIYARDIPLNSKLKLNVHNESNEIKINNSGIFSAGIGYSYSSKFRIEFRQVISRTMPIEAGYWKNSFMSSSVILGYNIF